MKRFLIIILVVVLVLGASLVTMADGQYSASIPFRIPNFALRTYSQTGWDGTETRYSMPANSFSDLQIYPDPAYYYSSVLDINFGRPLTQYAVEDSVSLAFEIDVALVTETNGKLYKNNMPLFGFDVCQFLDSSLNALATLPDTSIVQYFSVVSITGVDQHMSESEFISWLNDWGDQFYPLTYTVGFEITSTTVRNNYDQINAAPVLRLYFDGYTYCSGYMRLSSSGKTLFTFDSASLADLYSQQNEAYWGFDVAPETRSSMINMYDTFSYFGHIVDSFPSASSTSAFATLLNVIDFSRAEVKVFFAPFFDSTFLVTIGGYTFNPLALSVTAGLSLTIIEFMIYLLAGSNDYRRKSARSSSKEA